MSSALHRTASTSRRSRPAKAALTAAPNASCSAAAAMCITFSAAACTAPRWVSTDTGSRIWLYPSVIAAP